VVRPCLPALQENVSGRRVNEFHDIPAQNLALVLVPVQGKPGRVDVDHPAFAGDAHCLHGVLEEGPVLSLRIHERVLGRLRSVMSRRMVNTAVALPLASRRATLAAQW